MEEKIYVHSIMTMMFTKDGDVIVVKNDKNELDTLPQYFLGKKENQVHLAGAWPFLFATECNFPIKEKWQ